MKRIPFTLPVRQEVWGWPAILNLTLGGTGAGFYLLSCLVAAFNHGMGSHAGVVAAALIGLGFLSLTLEAGRPFRGFYLLKHVHRSWMSREALAGAAFFFGVILNLFYPHWVFRLFMAVSAIGLVVSHGFILYDALAVMAWRAVLVPMLVITSAFVLGEGLMLLFVSLGMADMNISLVIIGLIFLLLDLVLWLLYLGSSRDDNRHTATTSLRCPKALLVSVGLGHLIPIMCLIVLLMVSDWRTASGMSMFVPVIAGLAMIAGGVNQKSGIIEGVSYLRGMVLTSHAGRTAKAGVI